MILPMKTDLSESLHQILVEMGVSDIVPTISRTQFATHGDYTSTVALSLARTLKKNPISIAEEIRNRIAAYQSAVAQKQPDHSTDQSGQKVSVTNTHNSVLQAIEKIEVVKPGYINIWLTASALSTQLTEVLKNPDRFGTSQTSEKKTIMVEFAHPNTHKAFHIGHLRNITTGEAIVRLLESQGTKVVRANYQGDVGMHIAKAIYGILHSLSSQPPTGSGGPGIHMDNFIDSRLLASRRSGRGNDKSSLQERIEFLGQAYAAGSTAYEEDESAKKQIGVINKQIYEWVASKGESGIRSTSSGQVRKGERIDQKTDDKIQNTKVIDAANAQLESIGKLYDQTRQWSLDYFEGIYKRVGSHFDRYYFESEMVEKGKQIVADGLKRGIFEESDGAIIFPGKKFGLHNRVFVTGEGNVTYEGKDLSLGPTQFSEYHPDLIIHVVGPEQAGYFQVVFEALAQMFPQTRGKEFHLVYGWVKLKHGKMSSRSGNVILGEWLLDTAKAEIYNILSKSKSNYSKSDQELIAEKCAIAAVKYSFLRVSTQQEISFDIDASVNFEGDSGPYLLYSYARAKSVLRKATQQTVISDQKTALDLVSTLKHIDLKNISLTTEEREILRRLMYFPEIVNEAAGGYTPSLICNYLFELAQSFNLFYAKHSILGTAHDNKINEQTRQFRVALTSATAQVFKKGLYLLGVDVLEKM